MRYWFVVLYGMGIICNGMQVEKLIKYILAANTFNFQKQHVTTFRKMSLTFGRRQEWQENASL